MRDDKLREELTSIFPHMDGPRPLVEMLLPFVKLKIAEGQYEVMELHLREGRALQKKRAEVEALRKEVGK